MLGKVLVGEMMVMFLNDYVIVIGLLSSCVYVLFVPLFFRVVPLFFGEFS